MDEQTTWMKRKDAYLNRELSPEEMAAFEEETKGNPALYKDLEDELRAKVSAWAKGREEQKAAFDTLYASLQTETPKTRRLSPKWMMAVAAGILLLCLTAYFLLSPPPPQADIYTQYYERPAAPEVLSMPTTADSLVRAAHIAYQKGDCPKAGDIYQTLIALADNDQKPRASFYLGICLLESGKYPEAIQAFEHATKNPLQADWYIALTYLKAGDHEAAKKQLQKIVDYPGHYYGEKAKELLQKIHR